MNRKEKQARPAIRHAHRRQAGRPNEEAMTLELELIHVVDEAQRLSMAVREPLNGESDAQVEWFDMWSKKMKESGE